MKKCLLLSMAACSMFLLTYSQVAAATRLFILSGQSNMAALAPDISFTPTLKSAFPDDDLIVVKEADNGQPILKWYRDWTAANGSPGEHPNEIGRIYKRLMDKVTEALKEKPTPDTVTFVWMQGEADAREGGDVYERSLKGLIAQVRDDLKRKDVTVVIGRLSDFEDDKVPRPFWDQIRKIQVDTAEADPLAGWVDTDDLNGPNNSLHYGRDGYKALGERFAKKAVELTKKGQK